ncbi:MAG TPA: hypothetical protein VF331_17490 [Polyangiales bacterium]
MSDDDASELIREIAAAHGVALDRDDPVLILQTATRKILQDTRSKQVAGRCEARSRRQRTPRRDRQRQT